MSFFFFFLTYFLGCHWRIWFNFVFSQIQLGKTARSLLWLCSALWAVLSWAGLLATRLVGYKRGPKECSPKTSLAYSLWTQAAMSRVQQRAADIFCFGFVFCVIFFCIFIFCLLLQQQQVNQILFNELAPTFDPLPGLLFPPFRARYWHASAAPYRRSRGSGGSGQGVRLVCQKNTATKKNKTRSKEREREQCGHGIRQFRYPYAVKC